MEEEVDASLHPDENGILDLHDSNWVTLDDVVWTFGDCLLILNVANNQLVKIPPALGNLVLLRELILPNNQISTFPSQLARCVQLRRLDLHNNRLATLPKEIQFCERLEEINVATNQLQTLPDELGKLSQLRLLDVSQNQLRFLPDSLCECSKLESLICHSNPLQDVPKTLQGNTQLVLWICGQVKQHKAAIQELEQVNGDLENLAKRGDEERLHLREEINMLSKQNHLLLRERPKYYLLLKNTALKAAALTMGDDPNKYIVKGIILPKNQKPNIHAISQVCTIM